MKKKTARQRNTRQKRTVSEVLHDAERPLTIHEILARAQKKLPNLGVATVYREVGRLCEAGEVQSVIIPGDPVRYETHDHHHHHFKCTGCDRVFELNGCSASIAKMVPEGFIHTSHDITLYGLCGKCA